VDARSRLKALITEKCVLRGEFVLASGLRSKVFFDCKRITLDPEGLHLIAGLILEMIDDLGRRDGRPIDAIGGPTIGADPVVGHVAGRSWERAHRPAAPAGWPATAPARDEATAAGDTGLAVPADHPAPAPRPLRGFLIRKETKDHGTQRIIENEIPRGARVVIFEDVVTTGGSTLEAIRKAQEVGLEVAGVIAIVDREQGGAESLARFRYLPLFKKSEFGL